MCCVTELLNWLVIMAEDSDRPPKAGVFISNDRVPEKQAYFIPAVTQCLTSEVPGKKVLDVGCGPGDWCYLAAMCGAQSVDGFDIQESMVQMAKQATSQFTTVNIRVGDAMKMPYKDNSFDIAMSLYVTCMLRPEACIGHSKELHRVLAPGGKAIVINFSNPAYDKLYVSKEADKSIIEKEIDEKLASLPANPKYDEILRAFVDMKDLLLATFAIDVKSGHLFRITDVGQLSNGQEIWFKIPMMVTYNYFYDDKYFQDLARDAGLCIDQIENYYTEERRIAYNRANPQNTIDNVESIEHPPFLMYHLSKPLDSN